MIKLLLAWTTVSEQYGGGVAYYAHVVSATAVRVHDAAEDAAHCGDGSELQNWETPGVKCQNTSKIQNDVQANTVVFFFTPLLQT